MKYSIFATSMLAMMAAASPVEKESRQQQDFVPFNLGDSTTGAVAGASVPFGQSRTITSLFGSLGSPVYANFGAIISGAAGECYIYSDLATTNLVAVFNGTNPAVSFPRTNLDNGLINCFLPMK